MTKDERIARTTMDPYDLVGRALTAFDRHIEDGTVQVRLYLSDPAPLAWAMDVDGGNWQIGFTTDGTLFCSVPHNDARYMADDPAAFVANVFGTEAVESLWEWDQLTLGAVVAGLRATGETWSAALADRIEEV